MDTPFLFISISACYKPPNHHSSLITLQGFPTATQRGGMLCVTTLPAPMVVPSPISTPGKMVAPPPIQTLAPILMGRTVAFPVILSSGDTEPIGRLHRLFHCETIAPCTKNLRILCRVPERSRMWETKVWTKIL